MKYYVGKYVTYYEHFKNATELLKDAKTTLSTAKEAIVQLNSVVSFIESANWSGEAKSQLVSSSLPQLRSRIDILKQNLANSLVPAAYTTIEQLLVNLEEMQAKDTSLDEKKADLKIAKANEKEARKAYKNASNYTTKNGESEYTGAKVAAQMALNVASFRVNNLNLAITTLKSRLDELKDLCDSNISAIESYDNATDFSGAENGLISDIEGLENWQATFFEKDGVFYQIPCVEYNGSIITIEPQYVISIDMNSFKQLLNKKYGSNHEKLNEVMGAYNKIYEFLKEKEKNPSNGKTYLDFTIYVDKHGNSFQRTEGKREEIDREVVGLLFNQILESSYSMSENNTVGEYVTIASTVATLNPLVTFGYAGTYEERVRCVGAFESITTYSGNTRANCYGVFDCGDFVNWIYFQALNKINQDIDNSSFSMLTPLTMLNNSTVNLADFNKDDSLSITDIEIGSVVSKKIPNNYHVGIIVGTGIDSEGNEVIFVAQAKGGSVGGSVCIVPFSVDKFNKEWVSVKKAGVTGPDDMADDLTSNS